MILCGLNLLVEKHIYLLDASLHCKIQYNLFTAWPLCAKVYTKV